jgi:GTP-binding protein HflX
VLLVFTKADLDPDAAKMLAEDPPGSVAISSATGAGVDELLRCLGDRHRTLTKIAELVIPYDRGDVLASVHREGEVVSTTQNPEGFHVRARLSDASAGRLDEFVVTPA